MTHDSDELPSNYDEFISLREASDYSGLSADSIRVYAVQRRLKAKKTGHFWVTTRRWMDEYLESRDERGRKPRSEGGT